MKYNYEIGYGMGMWYAVIKGVKITLNGVHSLDSAVVQADMLVKHIEKCPSILYDI
jgi:hypothetical protein